MSDVLEDKSCANCGWLYEWRDTDAPVAESWYSCDAPIPAVIYENKENALESWVILKPASQGKECSVWKPKN